MMATVKSAWAKKKKKITKYTLESQSCELLIRNVTAIDNE